MDLGNKIYMIVKKTISLKSLLISAFFLWLTYPFIHIYKVKLTEDNIDYTIPEGYADDISELNKTKIRNKVILSEDINKATSQLDSLVILAKTKDIPISIVGKKHSMGGQTLNNDSFYLSLENINHLELDSQNNLLTVGSGATWIDAIEFLDKQKKSVHVMQSFSDFSIGGSLSVNAHGWHPGAGPLGNTIKELLVYTPDQGLMRCSSKLNSELFSLVIGGYGLFGIILEAKIKVVDNLKLKYSLYKIEPDKYVDSYIKLLKNNPNINLIYGRLDVAYDNFLKEATINTYTKVSEEPTSSFLNYKVNEFKRMVFRASVRSNYGKKVRWFLERHITPILNKKVTTRNIILDDRSDLIKNKHSNSVDILHEYFIPNSHVNSFINGLKSLLPNEKIDLLNVTIREVNVDLISKLPYARENVFGFVMLFNQLKTDNQEIEMKKLTQSLINLCHKNSGVFYMPYRLHATVDQFHKQYPMADKVFSLKEKYDKGKLLRNKLYDKYNRR